MSTFTLKALAKNWPMDHNERCKSMFNNEILSDVKFVVQASQNGESDSKRRKIVIPAHKFLLSICSPVFFAMFCGEMAETKEHIDLPDCEYEGIYELLRYIYTDEVCLNGDNVMQVLYLAEKYMIPGLISECTAYLGNNLDLSNLFCVLKHAKQYDNTDLLYKDLLYKCWELMDNNMEEVLKSADFMRMERCVLEELLDRDTLDIREVELFKGVVCWAEKECERQNLKVNDGSVKRQVLGEQIVQKMRFPVMKQSEFVDVVVGSNILTQEETSNIMKYFNSTLTSPVGFIETERESFPLRCCRYKSFLYQRMHLNDPERDACVRLTVDKDILLYGVSLFGNDAEDYSVTLKIENINHRSFFAATSGTFTAKEKMCNCGSYYGFDVLFNSPVALKKNIEYMILVSIEGADWMYKHGPCNNVPCAGVVFYVDSLLDFVEFLFKIK